MKSAVSLLASALLLSACASERPIEATDYWTGVIHFAPREFYLRDARHHENGKISEVYRCLGGVFPRALLKDAKAEYDGEPVVVVAHILDWPADAAFVRINRGDIRITNHECASPFVLIGAKVWSQERP